MLGTVSFIRLSELLASFPFLFFCLRINFSLGWIRFHSRFWKTGEPNIPAYCVWSNLAASRAGLFKLLLTKFNLTSGKSFISLLIPHIMWSVIERSCCKLFILLMTDSASPFSSKWVIPVFLELYQFEKNVERSFCTGFYFDTYCCYLSHVNIYKGHI